MAEANSEAKKHEVKEESSKKEAEAKEKPATAAPKKEAEAKASESKEAEAKKEAEKQPRPHAATKRVRKDDNIIFVGKKPAMSYVLAVITQFSEGNDEVFVKARGKSISRAVDVVEVVRKKFMNDLKCDFESDTQVIVDERNQKINVSTLSAKLSK